MNLPDDDYLLKISLWIYFVNAPINSLQYRRSIWSSKHIVAVDFLHVDGLYLSDLVRLYQPLPPSLLPPPDFLHWLTSDWCAEQSSHVSVFEIPSADKSAPVFDVRVGGGGGGGVH